MVKSNNLPPLRVGQVWQCRQQDYRVTIVAEIHDESQWGHWVSRVCNSSGRTEEGGRYSDDRGDETSYWIVRTPNNLDLVRLLYPVDE